MSTVFTCTTPDEGWALFSHFLGNKLLSIRMCQERKKNDKEVIVERDKIISNTWCELVGSLYLIMRRMQTYGYNDDAAKMQQIIDMTTELDLTDPATHDKIHDKHKELDKRVSEFDEALAKLRKNNKI
jgi:hypothetical protein